MTSTLAPRSLAISICPTTYPTVSSCASSDNGGDGPDCYYAAAPGRRDNYSGTLPVLELEDGTLIAKCTAITQYLNVLTGTTAREQALIHMMNKRAEIELMDAVSVYFHHATPGLGPYVEIYQNNDWGLRQRDKAVRGMHYFDNVLKEQAFVADDHSSMADITVIGGLIFAELARISITAECEALIAWYSRIHDRPSVRSPITMCDSPQEIS